MGLFFEITDVVFFFLVKCLQFSCGLDVFGSNLIRNIRNLMRIYCFGINLLFVTVFIFLKMVFTPSECGTH